MEEVQVNNNDLAKEVGNMQEIERKRMQDEFNSQRAKFKELYLQKEAELLSKNEECTTLKTQILQLKNELDDAKSQLVIVRMTREDNYCEEKRKADEEIATLQRIVHETVEESSLYDEELEKLRTYIHHLQNEIAVLKHEKQHSPSHSAQEHSLAPSVVLNALTKGIKKLGAETFNSQDVEESTKKLQDDAEELKSLIEPLEDQIRALKEKLRTTDELLQRCKECGHTQYQPLKSLVDQSSQHINLQSTTSTNTSFESQRLESTSTCDMCSNYEAQLVGEQQKTKELDMKLNAADKAVERHKEELLKEIGFRKDMEEKWNEKKEEHKQQVGTLTRVTECTEQDIKELRQYFNQVCIETKNSLARMTNDRERIQLELNRLQSEIDMLIGKYERHSQELQSEVINIPDNVEELQELVLKSHEDLIIAKIAKEAAEERLNNLHTEILLLKNQIVTAQNEKQALEVQLTQEIDTLRKELNHREREIKLLTAHQEKHENREKASQLKLSELQKNFEETSETLKNVEKQNVELRTRIHSLQHDFATTETVQKDFVRLTQSLQVQLEKIRQADTQVRWQHEEDVDECPTCHLGFSSTKHKQHCRHCGQIFCQTCLTRIVESGPRMRPSKVCDVCHTLLDKTSAPYFSEAPPMT